MPRRIDSSDFPPDIKGVPASEKAAKKERPKTDSTAAEVGKKTFPPPRPSLRLRRLTWLQKRRTSKAITKILNTPPDLRPPRSSSMDLKHLPKDTPTARAARKSLPTAPFTAKKMPQQRRASAPSKIFQEIIVEPQQSLDILKVKLGDASYNFDLSEGKLDNWALTSLVNGLKTPNEQQDAEGQVKDHLGQLIRMQETTADPTKVTFLAKQRATTQKILDGVEAVKIPWARRHQKMQRMQQKLELVLNDPKATERQKIQARKVFSKSIRGLAKGLACEHVSHKKEALELLEQIKAAATSKEGGLPEGLADQITTAADAIVFDMEDLNEGLRNLAKREGLDPTKGMSAAKKWLVKKGVLKPRKIPIRDVIKFLGGVAAATPANSPIRNHLKEYMNDTARECYTVLATGSSTIDQGSYKKITLILSTLRNKDSELHGLFPAEMKTLDAIARMADVVAQMDRTTTVPDLLRESGRTHMAPDFEMLYNIAMTPVHAALEGRQELAKKANLSKLAKRIGFPPESMAKNAKQTEKWNVINKRRLSTQGALLGAWLYDTKNFDSRLTKLNPKVMETHASDTLKRYQALAKLDKTLKTLGPETQELYRKVVDARFNMALDGKDPNWMQHIYNEKTFSFKSPLEVIKDSGHQNKSSSVLALQKIVAQATGVPKGQITGSPLDNCVLILEAMKDVRREPEQEDTAELYLPGGTSFSKAFKALKNYAESPFFKGTDLERAYLLNLEAAYSLGGETPHIVDAAARGATLRRQEMIKLTVKHIQEATGAHKIDLAKPPEFLTEDQHLDAEGVTELQKWTEIALQKLVHLSRGKARRSQIMKLEGSITKLVTAAYQLVELTPEDIPTRADLIETLNTANMAIMPTGPTAGKPLVQPPFEGALRNQLAAEINPPLNVVLRTKLSPATNPFHEARALATKEQSVEEFKTGIKKIIKTGTPEQKEEAIGGLSKVAHACITAPKKEAVQHRALFNDLYEFMSWLHSDISERQSNAPEIGLIEKLQKELRTEKLALESNKKPQAGKLPVSSARESVATPQELQVQKPTQTVKGAPLQPSNVEKIEAEVFELGRELKGYRQEVENLENRMNNLETAPPANLEEEIRAAIEKVERFEKKINKIETGIESIDALRLEATQLKPKIRDLQTECLLKRLEHSEIIPFLRQSIDPEILEEALKGPLEELETLEATFSKRISDNKNRPEKVTGGFREDWTAEQLTLLKDEVGLLTNASEKIQIKRDAHSFLGIDNAKKAREFASKLLATPELRTQLDAMLREPEVPSIDKQLKLLTDAIKKISLDHATPQDRQPHIDILTKLHQNPRSSTESSKYINAAIGEVRAPMDHVISLLSKTRSETAHAKSLDFLMQDPNLLFQLNLTEGVSSTKINRLIASAKKIGTRETDPLKRKAYVDTLEKVEMSLAAGPLAIRAKNAREALQQPVSIDTVQGLLSTRLQDLGKATQAAGLLRHHPAILSRLCEELKRDLADPARRASAVRKLARITHGCEKVPEGERVAYGKMLAFLAGHVQRTQDFDNTPSLKKAFYNATYTATALVSGADPTQPKLSDQEKQIYVESSQAALLPLAALGVGSISEQLKTRETLIKKRDRAAKGSDAQKTAIKDLNELPVNQCMKAPETLAQKMQEGLFELRLSGRRQPYARYVQVASALQMHHNYNLATTFKNALTTDYVAEDRTRTNFQDDFLASRSGKKARLETPAYQSIFTGSGDALKRLNKQSSSQLTKGCLTTPVLDTLLSQFERGSESVRDEVVTKLEAVAARSEGLQRALIGVPTDEEGNLQAGFMEKFMNETHQNKDPDLRRLHVARMHAAIHTKGGYEQFRELIKPEHEKPQVSNYYRNQTEAVALMSLFLSAELGTKQQLLEVYHNLPSYKKEAVDPDSFFSEVLDMAQKKCNSNPLLMQFLNDYQSDAETYAADLNLNPSGRNFDRHPALEFLVLRGLAPAFSVEKDPETKSLSLKSKRLMSLMMSLVNVKNLKDYTTTQKKIVSLEQKIGGELRFYGPQSAPGGANLDVKGQPAVPRGTRKASKTNIERLIRLPLGEEANWELDEPLFNARTKEPALQEMANLAAMLRSGKERVEPRELTNDELQQAIRDLENNLKSNKLESKKIALATLKLINSLGLLKPEKRDEYNKWLKTAADAVSRGDSA